MELRGCERTREVLGDIKAAQETDWDEEYLAPILAVRVVDDLDAAMEHIESTAPGIPTPSSPRTSAARAASCAKSIPVR